MNWRAFMFAADALRLEDGISWTVRQQPGVSVPRVPSSAEVRAQNAQSMAMLSGLMKGVQGAPGVKR